MPLNTVKGGPQARLQSLITIRDKRLEMPADSPYRMADVCKQIPHSLVGIDTSCTGYNKSCYKRFIMNLDRLKVESVPIPKTPPMRHSPRKNKSSTPHVLSPETRLFPDTCIFCDCRNKRVGKSREHCREFASCKNRAPVWKAIQNQAKDLGMNALHRMVYNEDLYARGAQHHPSCWKEFKTKHDNYVKACEKGDELTQSEERAFEEVLKCLQSSFIEKEELMELHTLRTIYTVELDRRGFPNSNYRAEKLKEKIALHEISEKIEMTQIRLFR